MNAFENHCQVDSINTDFSKAFVLPIIVLCKKLENMGFQHCMQESLARMARTFNELSYIFGFNDCIHVRGAKAKDFFKNV